jgi:hypothetical protein
MSGLSPGHFWHEITESLKDDVTVDDKMSPLCHGFAAQPRNEVRFEKSDV